MYYTTTNLQTSLTTALATKLREAGYDVLWYATGTLDQNLVTPASPKAVVTLVPEFPANPAVITRLKSDSGGDEEIVVPALTLHLPGDPRYVESLGIGHEDALWERVVRIDGLALDDFQQRELADFLFEWLKLRPSVQIPVANYDDDPISPDALDPCWVHAYSGRRSELPLENEAARYYIRADVAVRYIE